MLKLFFLVTWRNLLRDKLTSCIQLLGLVIGLACFIVIQLYVEHQKSYNQLFTDAAKTYRVNLFRDENKPQSLTPLRLSDALASNFSGIDEATRVSATSVSIKHQQQVFSERVLFVDDNYFRFFDFELLEGDRMTALDAPDALVLHEEMAVKYFASKTGVLGKRLMINGQWHQVTGVVKKTSMPHTMPLTMLVPMERFLSILPSADWGEMWNFNATITFVKIPDVSSIEGLEASVSDYYDMRAEGLSSFKSYRVEFGPLLEIYLDDETTLSLIPPGSDMMVKVFSFISMLILLLACVNFTNLSTSAALKEGKNVGVRKALGASKLQLVCEYLLQAILFTLFATVLAVGVVVVCLPGFNMLMNAEISFALSASLAAQLLGLAAIVGVLAGLYPAFFLSNLEAAHVLKGLVSSSKAGVGIRQALIIFQFGIAGFLLVASLIVNWQMGYIHNMAQGFERDNVIVVSRGADIFERFKTQAQRHPDVMSVTMSHTVPTKATRTSNMVRRPDDLSNSIWVGSNPVSYDFFQTFGIEILAGRVFSEAFINDAYVENEQNPSETTGKIIINRSLATTLGWEPQQAVGEMVTLGNENEGLHSHQIIGVTEDTHYISAKNSVPPMIYVLSAKPQDLSLRWTSIRFKQGISPVSVKQVEDIWLSLGSDLAFKYDWVNDLFAANYRQETQQTRLINAFSVLAVIVTAIGLFGLAAFSTQKRVKEIAVRRVLGASTLSLCLQLVNQFALLVLIANVLAMPIAYSLMRDWLNDFIYRIDMPLAAFVLSLGFSLLIAYATVSFIAYRGATAKPVDALAQD